MNQAMQQFTGNTYTPSEQHSDMSRSKQARDNTDMMKIFEFLQSRNPFNECAELINIFSGVTEETRVNVY